MIMGIPSFQAIADKTSLLPFTFRLEIGAQEARKRRPEFSDDALLELVKAVHEHSRNRA